MCLIKTASHSVTIITAFYSRKQVLSPYFRASIIAQLIKTLKQCRLNDLMRRVGTGAEINMQHCMRLLSLSFEFPCKYTQTHQEKYSVLHEQVCIDRSLIFISVEAVVKRFNSVKRAWEWNRKERRLGMNYERLGGETQWMSFEVGEKVGLFF